MDTQIFYFVFVPALALFLRRKSIYTRYSGIFFLLPVLLIALYVSNMDFNAFREFFSFFSFIVVYFLIVQAISYGYVRTIYNWSCIASFTYFVVGAIQLSVDKYIFDFIVDVRTSDARGVTSLATEPTFFGIVCILLIFVILGATQYRPNKIGRLAIFVNLISIVFLAKSSLAILLLGFAGILVLVVVSFYGWRYLLYSSIVVVGILITATISLYNVSSDSRVFELFDKGMEFGFISLLFSDASVNMRVAGIILPFNLAIDNYFFPYGFGNYSDSLKNLSGSFEGLFRDVVFQNDRVMSFIGSFFFSLGWFGIAFLSIIFYKSVFYRSLTKEAVAEFVFIIILLLNAVPVAMPLVAMLFAVLSMRDQYRNNGKVIL